MTTNALRAAKIIGKRETRKAVTRMLGGFKQGTEEMNTLYSSLDSKPSATQREQSRREQKQQNEQVAKGR